MKITSIEFTRKFNLGNFESQDIKLAANLDDDEDVDQAIVALKEKAKLHSGKA